MKAQEITIWCIEHQEIRKLPDGHPVLMYDTLYSKYEIKHKGKNKFPAVPRFQYALLTLPEGWEEQ